MPARRCVHIPNAVREEFFELQRKPVLGTVMCYADSRRIKGLDILLKAWPIVVAECSHARLQLYADRDDPVVERLLTVLPASVSASVSLIGPVHGQRQIESFTSAHAIVLPSRFEVSPVVAAEAMAAGVPLVATDVGGTADMLDGAARLCRPDARDVARALIEVLAGRVDLDAMTAAGKQVARSFKPHEVARRHLALYERLVDKAASRRLVDCASPAH
jgi:glycosyltransferase involved in cell wall biosynthesis